MDPIYTQLAALAKKYGARRLVLFGSRARGDHRPSSDIDLAVYGMPPQNRARFDLDAEELPTLLKLDIAHITPDTDPKFLSNIQKDGVTLMGSFSEKYEKLTQAVSRLRESLDEYQSATSPSSTLRDGVIQRFEFCTELAWKTMREYLLDQGFAGPINTPRAVLRQAYAAGVIQDDAWLTMLDDRNLTSHVYDDATAAQIFARIRSQYLALFDALIDYLRA